MPRPIFRLIDLFVFVAVLVALSIGVVGVRQNAQENSVIVGCANQLGQLAQALVLYQGLNDGQFPRTRYDPAAPVTAFTAPDAPEPFAENGPAVNDASAAMFLLARVIELPPTGFTCPSAVRHGLSQEADFDRKSAKTKSNFASRLQSNYALANMYPDADAVAAGYSLDRFRERLPAGFVIAGDINPGGEGARSATTQMSRMNLRMGNSPNHQRDGQNVMFADGSVQFFNSPFVGVGFDNIFTGHADAKQPADAADSVLLPVWADGPQEMSSSTYNRRWVLSVAAVLTFAVLGWLVWHGTRAKPARAA